MDSITQAALGAGIFGTVLGRHHGRKAVVAGAMLGTLPDLDVVIRYADPVLSMINHRGFSHSVFVLTALALALTAAMRAWKPSTYGSSRLFWAIWLTLITHPLLDAFTAYGTQLLWPLRPTPTAWSTLFIIDPFFSVPLTLAVLAALIVGPGQRVRKAIDISLVWCGMYLAASIGAKYTMEEKVRTHLERSGVQVVDMFSTPQPFSILLWRVVARASDDHYYEATVGVLDKSPPTVLRQPFNSELADAVPASVQLDGLRWFSGNWIRYDDVNGHLVVSDLRMGLGAGYYSFRFLFAQRPSASLPWQSVTPQYWPSPRGTSELKLVLHRIWDDSMPLPQARWAERMTRGEPAATPDHGDANE